MWVHKLLCRLGIHAAYTMHVWNKGMDRHHQVRRC